MKTDTLTPETLKKTRQRLNLAPAGFAAYLGVSVHTLTKWENGTRAAPGIAARLLDVLATVETLAPGLHAAMLPAPAGPLAKRRRGRAAPAAPTTQATQE